MAQTTKKVAQREELWRWAVRALKLPTTQVWLDYDKEADVLYISLRKPQRATDSVLEDDIIYHYDGRRLVGVTVLNAKHRA
ncbi:MAG: DUF2283 domain-containing protein [Candidatus Caldarchaeum sp.]